MQRALNQSFRFQLQSSTERLTASEGARGSRQPKSQVAFLRPRNSDFTTAATTATRRAAAAVASARRALMVPPFPSLPFPPPLLSLCVSPNGLSMHAPPQRARRRRRFRRRGIRGREDQWCQGEIQWFTARLSTVAGAGGQAGGAVSEKWYRSV